MAKKDLRLNLKHTSEDKEKIEYIAQKGGLNASEAIRKSIAYAYQSLKDALEPEHRELTSPEQ